MISRLAVGGKGNLLKIDATKFVPTQNFVFVLSNLLFIWMLLAGWMICLHLAILNLTSRYSTDVVNHVKLFFTNVVRFGSFESLHS